MAGWLLNLGFVISSLPACANSSLLCGPFKILERLVYTRVEPIIYPLLPQEQAGFQHGRSGADQVTLLTEDMENSFLLKRPELCLSTSQQPTTL